MSEKNYKIKNLDKIEILNIIEDPYFYKNINIYFKNDIIKIKKYTLYQLINMKKLNNINDFKVINV